MRVRLPRDPKTWLHAAVVGILMHGIYLGRCFFTRCITERPGGISALIVGVQAGTYRWCLAGLLLSERLSARAWFGLALGFAGITMVVWEQAGDTGGFSRYIMACVTSLIGITLANFVSKAVCRRDRSAGRLDHPIRRSGSDDVDFCV